MIGAICGWPGSGKTSLLKFMLKEKKLLFKKFDEVIIMSPSSNEFEDLFLPETNLTNAFNFDFIKNHIARINQTYPNEYTNLLIIIDDYITEINKNARGSEVQRLAFNRRVNINFKKHFENQSILIKKFISCFA